MPEVWPLLPSVIALAAGALVIGVGRPRLVRLADRLADQTGLGEAFFGALILPVRSLIRQARSEPMWRARSSDETRPDTPDHDAESVPLGRSALELALLGAVVVAAGWAVARGGAGIALQTGLTETAVGAVFTGVSTSLPELVTTIAAEGWVIGLLYAGTIAMVAFE